MIKRYMHDIQIAFESIVTNKLKSLLTALGIIFGVASVICMMAIGKGAQQEILEQIKMVGVNNIVITPIKPEDQASDEEKEQKNSKKEYSPGLTLKDVGAIQEVLPSVQRVSPEIHKKSFLIKSGVRHSAKMIGVNEDYFEIYNLQLDNGKFFSASQLEQGQPVCIIGANVKTKFFNTEDPINNYIKFGNVWLKVIGVLEKNMASVSSFDDIGVSVMNDNVYVPAKTMLMRYENRAIVNTKKQSGFVVFFGGGMMSGGGKKTTSNYHQLDKIIVQVKETEQLQSTTKTLSRMLLRRHLNVKDFEVSVPELLLKQQQKTKDIFNFVLGAIASISLLVGGIGIMNIMYATVMERIKEIGIRLSIGAKKADIVAQFLSEAILISFSGGIIGVILGIVLAKLVSAFTDILTVLSGLSILVSFVISVGVGVIFGYAPARKAAQKDPIESLRYE